MTNGPHMPRQWLKPPANPAMNKANNSPSEPSMAAEHWLMPAVSKLSKKGV